MAYGDYDGPDKPDKGLEGGSCNRQRCQAAPACWYNHGMDKWYCVDCRNAIQFDNVNFLAWTLDTRNTHPMFETREMLDERAYAEREAAMIKAALKQPEVFTFREKYHAVDFDMPYIENYGGRRGNRTYTKTLSRRLRGKAAL